ncbi:MAG TPA: hypothetical protein VF773_23165 [Verrucomicrobiae bacterium]
MKKNFKKNAALVAGIMFVGGCATSDAQRASYPYDSPSRYDRADVSVSSTEVIERDSPQRAIPPVDVDTSTAVSYDAAHGSHGATVSGTSSQSDISADSSVRGGSLDARGYDQDANNDEIEATSDPINPGKEADSSIRGGSVYARERDWNHDSEPSVGAHRENHHMKADSSIRGGSIEARGGREATGNYETTTRTDLRSDASAVFDADTDRDDFGQGSSATWKSDKAHGSVRGSSNWNPSDDMLPDGTTETSATSYDVITDASVGGAATAESGSASGDSSIRIESDLNSSDQLESNISGELDLDEQESKLERSSDIDSESVESNDQNARDSLSSSTSSERSSDIHHDAADLNSAESNSSDINVEAAGAAATSESGYSSSEVEVEVEGDEFESNDPAMKRSGSPLGLSGGEPNFLNSDNRARGVGSAASGDFATSPVNSGVELDADDELEDRDVKRGSDLEDVTSDLQD